MVITLARTESSPGVLQLLAKGSAFPLQCAKSHLSPKKVLRHTRVQSEEPRGAAKILPGEGGVLLEVVHEDIVESLRHICTVEDICI